MGHTGEIIYFFAAIVFLIAVHEAGHLLAALSVGLPVSSMNVGIGPVLWEFQIGAVWCRLRLLPLAGNVTMCWLSRRRWKNITIFAAGPAANLAVITPLWLLDRHIAYWSLYMVIVNLIPATVAGQDTDGAAIIKEWRKRNENSRSRYRARRLAPPAE